MRGIRVSDQDRESVVVQLGTAAAEGRLTLEEFGERSIAAYSATAYEDLEALIIDLPRAARERVGHWKWDYAWQVAAIFGGLLWIPFFPFLDYAGVFGAIGILAGALVARNNLGHLRRAIAAIGIVGGSVGIALQVLWFVFQVVN